MPGLLLLEHALLCAGQGEGETKQKEPQAGSEPEAKLPHSCCRTSDTCPPVDTLQTARENKEPISTHLPEIVLQISCTTVLTFLIPWLSSTSLSVCQPWKGKAPLSSSILPLPATHLTAPAESAATVTNLPCYFLSFIYTRRTVAIQSEKAPCFQRRTAQEIDVCVNQSCRSLQGSERCHVKDFLH